MDTLHTVGRVWGVVQCLLSKLSALNRSWELGANPLLWRYAQWMTMAQCAKVFIGFPWGRTVVVSRDCGSCPHWPGMDWKNPLRGGKASLILLTYFSSCLVHLTFLLQVRSWVSASEILLFPLIWIYSGKTRSALSGEMTLCLPPKLKTVAKGWIFAMMSGMFFRKGACRCWQVLWGDDTLPFQKNEGQHAWIQWLAWMVGQVGTVVAPVHWVDSTIIWRFPTMGVPQNWCFYHGTSESD